MVCCFFTCCTSIFLPSSKQELQCCHSWDKRRAKFVAVNSNLTLPLILFPFCVLKKYIYLVIYVSPLSLPPNHHLLHHWNNRKTPTRCSLQWRLFFGLFFSFLFLKIWYIILQYSKTLQKNRDRKLLYYFSCKSAVIAAARIKLKKTET